MNRKTILIISYLTIIGWLISFIIYHNGGRSSLAQYHLKQSFGLGVLGAVLGLIFIPIIPIIFIKSFNFSTIHSIKSSGFNCFDFWNNKCIQSKKKTNTFNWTYVCK